MRFSLLDILLPRETKFFTMLIQQSEVVLEGCKAFSELVSKFDSLSESEILLQLKAINNLEQKGDDIEHKIIEELHKTFITPIDREDIHTIAISIDRILDILNGIAKKIEIYKIRQLPKNVINFNSIIIEIVSDMLALIAGLQSKKNITAIIQKMHSLENKADYLFHMSLADLFANETNAVTIIKHKEIYEHLEEIVDSVDFIGKIVRGIVVKVG